MLSPLLVTCLCFGAQVFASTTISTYSDVGCTDAVQSIDGPDTGICQENTLGSYTSFQVTSLDSLCAGMTVMECLGARIRLTRLVQSPFMPAQTHAAALKSGQRHSTNATTTLRLLSLVSIAAQR